MVFDNTHDNLTWRQTYRVIKIYFLIITRTSNFELCGWLFFWKYLIFKYLNIWKRLRELFDKNIVQYRYSTQGRVQHWATIGPTIRPQIMAEYRIFFQIARGGRVIHQSLANTNTRVKYHLCNHYLCQQQKVIL